MRVLVCGSRNFDNYDAIATMLDGLRDCHGGYGTRRMKLIAGEAPGADTIAKEWAALPHNAEKVLYIGFPADWAQYGKRAGYLRNQQMLDEGKPWLVVAFYKGLERSRGTSMMVDIARRAGVECWEIFAP